MGTGRRLDLASRHRNTILLISCLCLLWIWEGDKGVAGCRIAGFDSGECKENDDFSDKMPFCGKVVNYEACMPKYNPIFPNHTIGNKDRWIKTQFLRIVLERIRHERNETLMDLGVNEFGIEGEVAQRFWNGDEEDPR